MEENEFISNAVKTSRRTFLKASATIAGTAGALGVTGVSDLLASSEKPSKSSNKLPLKVAGYKLDRVEALINGKVQIEGCDAQFEIAAIGDMNTDVFSGSQSREVTTILTLAGVL